MLLPRRNIKVNAENTTIAEKGGKNFRLFRGWFVNDYFYIIKIPDNKDICTAQTERT